MWRGGLRFWRRDEPVLPGWTGTQPPRADRLGVRLQNSRFASSARPGLTIASLMHLEAVPTAVRVLLANDLREPWTADGVAVAPSAAVTRGAAPTPDVPWRRLTFGGQDAGMVPGRADDPGVPAHLWSDWLPVEGVPRQGGPGALLLVRTFAHQHSRFATALGPPAPTLQRLHAGFEAEGEHLLGDGEAFRRNDRLFACHGVQFASRVPGDTVLGVGDSIMQSACTTGEVSGYGARACRLVSTPQRPVSYVNEGFPGRNSFGFTQCGLWAVEAFRPQVALIQCWSRNEPWTAAQSALAFDRAMAVATACRTYGGVPILVTAAPGRPEHPDEDAARRAANARLHTLDPAVWPMLDLTALWGTGGTPDLFRRGYAAGDGFHPNDRACAVAAARLAPMLARILGP